ncbi:MAG: hypothetical protein JSV47_02560 [Deltaproteobacteria bacterium]|jgi:hypothetical protein|nr:MAG: hypothetical protein JSV47_02560 [Deltaproteobacteria bacterium]
MLISLEKTYELLGWEKLPGDKEDLLFLRMWLQEIVEEKGEAWVKEHREFLRNEWDYVLTLLPSADV